MATKMATNPKLVVVIPTPLLTYKPNRTTLALGSEELKLIPTVSFVLFSR